MSSSEQNLHQLGLTDSEVRRLKLSFLVDPIARNVIEFYEKVRLAPYDQHLRSRYNEVLAEWRHRNG